MRCVLVRRFRDGCDMQRGRTSRGERAAGVVYQEDRGIEPLENLHLPQILKCIQK